MVPVWRFLTSCDPQPWLTSSRHCLWAQAWGGDPCGSSLPMRASYPWPVSSSLWTHTQLKISDVFPSSSLSHRTYRGTRSSNEERGARESPAGVEGVGLGVGKWEAGLPQPARLRVLNQLVHRPLLLQQWRSTYSRKALTDTLTFKTTDFNHSRNCMGQLRSHTHTLIILYSHFTRPFHKEPIFGFVDLSYCKFSIWLSLLLIFITFFLWAFLPPPRPPHSFSNFYL